MSLTELTTRLSKTFDECLNCILTTDPQQQQQKEEEGLDTQINNLKVTFLQLEGQLKQLRLNALQDAELSTKESNKLLKRDINIKQKTINNYVEKLTQWENKIPMLIENSKRTASIRTGGTDFDSSRKDVVPPMIQVDDDDQMPLRQQEDIEMPIVTPNTVPTPLVETTVNNHHDNDNDDNDDNDDEDEDEDVEFEQI